jgi:hypothetical protein
VSTAYSHIWRAADTDFPCNLTGREGPDSDGQIYVEIVREDGLTYVPQEQLITFASWKAGQSKAAEKTPVDAAEKVQAGQAEKPVPIAVTWASTSSQERLGKIWTPEGEWPVTDGVKRKSYVFEHRN